MLGIGIAIGAQILCYAISVWLIRSADKSSWKTQGTGSDAALAGGVVFSGISVLIIAMYIILLVGMSTFAGKFGIINCI